ncbi:MAG: AraC family transcriptional regulator ligand-binding domain-containing protein [Polyangiaceae bacterium]
MARFRQTDTLRNADLRFAPPPIIPTRLAGRASSILRRRGVDPAPLIAKFGLPKSLEDDPLVLMTADDVEGFLSAAEELSGEPHLAIRAAEHAGTDVIAVLLFACSGAGDGRGALERYVRYFGSVHADLALSLEDVGDASALRVSLPGRPECLGRHWNEHWLVSFVLSARKLLGASFVPESVTLAHASPRSRDELVRVLGTTNISFGGEHNEVRIRTEELGRNVRSLGAPLQSLLAQYAHMLPPAAPPQTGLRGKLREAIRGALPQGEPSIAKVSRSLGMSARTLQRRLSESALTFQQVLDELRRDLALPQVQRGDRSLDEIAARLGYSQVSAFFRAFRRWTGATPRALRSRAPEP